MSKIKELVTTQKNKGRKIKKNWEHGKKKKRVKVPYRKLETKNKRTKEKKTELKKVMQAMKERAREQE